MKLSYLRVIDLNKEKSYDNSSTNISLWSNCFRKSWLYIKEWKVYVMWCLRGNRYSPQRGNSKLA